MKKKVIKYTIEQDGKKIKKGKIKAYMPSTRGLKSYIKDLPNVMPIDESMFIINMLNFHFLFPSDDIFYDKNIKNKELQYMLKQKENNNNSTSIKYDDLIYKSLLNDRIFKINMSPEEYNDFRIMILKEISDIKNDYSNMFDKELILNNYYKLEYKKVRSKMNYEEKRLFQLLFFGRKAFLYKIPALTQFMQSFFNANSELIFEGLILKRSNPDYKEKNEELKKKWYEFLNMYSIAIKNYNVIENAGDKEKIKEIIQNNFENEEIEILECIQENYSYDVICAKFNKNNEYINELLERLQNTIREESNNETTKKEN